VWHGGVRQRTAATLGLETMLGLAVFADSDLCGCALKVAADCIGATTAGTACMNGVITFCF